MSTGITTSEARQGLPAATCSPFLDLRPGDCMDLMRETPVAGSCGIRTTAIATKQFPNASKEEIQRIATGAMNHALGIK